eukprot:16021600-Heterocapsa_arctica.AAC.1
MAASAFQGLVLIAVGVSWEFPFLVCLWFSLVSGEGAAIPSTVILIPPNRAGTNFRCAKFICLAMAG